MRYLVIVLALLAPALRAQAASFNCAKASTAVEKMICADPRVSALDERLMDSYKRALTTAPNPNVLKAEQIAWLTGTRNKCQDAACLERTYSERLAVLDAIAKPAASAGSPPASPTGTYRTDGGELKVQALPGGKIRFEVVATFNMNRGEAAGEAPLNGNTAIYMNRDQDCALAFSFSGDRIDVKQDGGCGMGLNVSAMGTYTRASTAPPKFEAEAVAAAPPRRTSPAAAEPKRADPPPANKQAQFLNDARARNARKVAALDLPKSFLKATIYLQEDLFNRPQPFMPLEDWLALLYENKSIAKITAIKYGKSEGVLLKSPGVESYGFLFKYDDGDLFPSHVAKGDLAIPITDAGEGVSVMMGIMKLANDAFPE